MKTIKIEFKLYSPKELWIKFWNRFFWPRRKQCAEWMDLMEYRLNKAIVEEVIKKKLYDEKIISFNVADKLESSIRSIVKSECDAMKKLMSEPL